MFNAISLLPKARAFHSIFILNSHRTTYTIRFFHSICSKMSSTTLAHKHMCTWNSLFLGIRHASVKWKIAVVAKENRFTLSSLVHTFAVGSCLQFVFVALQRLCNLVTSLCIALILKLSSRCGSRSDRLTYKSSKSQSGIQFAASFTTKNPFFN